MWYEPPKYIKPVKDLNKELALLKGELDDKQAQITLAKFLYRNLGFTTTLLSGVELYADQLISIKGMLKSNYSLCVWGRGVSKTWTAAVYCILQMLFEPRTNILIAGPTFRTARFIFNHIESIAGQPEAQMLAQALGSDVIRRNDEFKWKINGGSIVAIPLNGEKIRGFRANVLVIDEFLLMSEEIVEKVLIPFLAVPRDLKRRKRIRAKEDNLIKKGLLSEDKRTKFKNETKLIALSSASFQCEYLYRKYQEYVQQIYDPTIDEEGNTYFISQLSWDSVSEDRIDKGVIKMAQTNQANSALFQREYCGQFVDGSDSYFSMNKMLDCSVKDGEDPTLTLKGDPDKKYILAIDPNLSGSSTADDFAMCMIEIDPNKVEGTIVHQYAESGTDLKFHIKYLHYLLTNFNVEMIIIDHAGYQFLEAANEAECMRQSNINIKVFDFSSEKDGDEYNEQLKQAQRLYNKQNQKIAFTQYFGAGDFIRKSNEWLQTCIDYKKIIFGGCIKGNSRAFERAAATRVAVKDILDTSELKPTDETPMQYFIDKQDILIKQTRYQCAAIEVKTSIKGNLSFDLPTILKNDKSSGRMRRDSYTALLLGCWGMKCYHDIKNVPKESFETFTPILV